MKRLIAIAILLAMPMTGATAADRGPVLLRKAVLTSHNQARHQFGVAPMSWSEELASEASRYAQQMARTGIYAHDRTPGRRQKMGENLWRGQRGYFSYEVMVGTMVAEVRNFRPGSYPSVSRTGNWSDVSHYTQIVWPTTTSVGCALASSATTDYLVCRYAPTGNKDGVYLAPGLYPQASRAAGSR